jgi:hypothetical protein
VTCWLGKAGVRGVRGVPGVRDVRGVPGVGVVAEGRGGWAGVNEPGVWAVGRGRKGNGWR